MAEFVADLRQQIVLVGGFEGEGAGEKAEAGRPGDFPPLVERHAGIGVQEWGDGVIAAGVEPMDLQLGDAAGKPAPLVVEPGKTRSSGGPARAPRDIEIIPCEAPRMSTCW